MASKDAPTRLWYRAENEAVGLSDIFSDTLDKIARFDASLSARVIVTPRYLLVSVPKRFGNPEFWRHVVYLLCHVSRHTVNCRDLLLLTSLGMTEWKEACSEVGACFVEWKEVNEMFPKCFAGQRIFDPLKRFVFPLRQFGYLSEIA